MSTSATPPPIQQQIDQAKWLFERTLGWIATADTKVGVAVAIDTALIGGLAAIFTTSDPSQRSAWAYLASFSSSFCMVIAVFCAGMAAIPRMLGPVHSLIFFGRIVERSESDYSLAFTTMTPEAFLRDLTVQIHRNSQIANSKHLWVRKSLSWSFVGGIPWIASVLLLIKT